MSATLPTKCAGVSAKARQLLQEYLPQLRRVNRLHLNGFIRVAEAVTLVEQRDVYIV